MPLQRFDHTLESHETIASLEKLRDETPVHCLVGPQTDPLSTAVRRFEELLPAKQQVDVRRVEMQCNRRTAFDDFKSGERSLPRAKIGMTPGRALAGLRQRKTQLAELLRGLSSELHDR